MQKKIIAPVIISCAVLFTQSPAFASKTQIPDKKKQAETEAYDADLFRQNTEVVSTHAEFLYWTVRESNLDYALEMQRPAWGPSDSYAQGDYQKATFEWNPGFRIAMSYYNAPKYWEVWGQYTWLHSKGRQSSDAPGTPDVFLDSTWPQVFTDPVSSAHSNIKFHYNLIELLTSRNFVTNPHLRLRFLGGLVGTLMDQNWKLNYKDAANNQTNITNNWDYWGAGIRIGTFLDWYVHGDFYLTGKATTALLLGRYHNHAFQKTTFAPTVDDNTTVPIRDAYYDDTRVAYNIQFSFGPSYQKRLNGCRIEVFAGYEFNAWFNLLQVFRSTGSDGSSPKETLVNTGTLSLDGLTARFTIDF